MLVHYKVLALIKLEGQIRKDDKNEPLTSEVLDLLIGCLMVGC